MTKDEFLDMINDFPAGKEMDEFWEEGLKTVDEFNQHDRVLGDKLLALITAVKDLGDYIVAKTEKSGDTAKS